MQSSGTHVRLDELSSFAGTEASLQVLSELRKHDHMREDLVQSDNTITVTLLEFYTADASRSQPSILSEGKESWHCENSERSSQNLRALQGNQVLPCRSIILSNFLAAAAQHSARPRLTTLILLAQVGSLGVDIVSGYSPLSDRLSQYHCTSPEEPRLPPARSSSRESNSHAMGEKKTFTFKPLLMLICSQGAQISSTPHPCLIIFRLQLFPKRSSMSLSGAGAFCDCQTPPLRPIETCDAFGYP